MIVANDFNTKTGAGAGVENHLAGSFVLVLRNERDNYVQTAGEII